MTSPSHTSSRTSSQIPVHTPSRTPAHTPAHVRTKGRGAQTNASGRHEHLSYHTVHDGWQQNPEPPPLKTTTTLETARTIITRNQSPDIGFDRSINPYRGCEHGCIYCYARPTHANMGLSPGLDFESRLFAKPNAPDLLREELAKPSYHPKPIAMGTNTDPYQPIERSMKITRALLEVLAETNHPVTIVSKSALIIRDLDILKPMAQRNLVRVAISITTLNPKLARSMEPRAAAPPKRLATLRTLCEAGIPTAVMFAPVIPMVNDAEMETVLEAAHRHGAQTAGMVLVRLPLEIKHLFREWLSEHLPDRAQRVMQIIRQTRGGKDYDSQWFQRGRGSGPYAEMLHARFSLAKKKFNKPMEPLCLTRFKPPALPPRPHHPNQGCLFGA